MHETELKIKVFGAAILRKKAQPIKFVTLEHRKLLSQMAQTMYTDTGIGLAAPQVGIGVQLVVADIGQGLYKLINPRIVKRQGQQVIKEGCLSVPGICIRVKRAKRVWVEALDEDNKMVKIQAQDLFACVLQHEIDHLKGKLIVDYASLLEKIKIKRKLAALKITSRSCDLKI